MDLTETIAPKSDQLERWLPVSGYEGSYEVSDQGRIKSLKRLDGSGHKILSERILKPSLTPKGYQQLTLCLNGSTRTFRVHRVVLATFVGPCPEGMEARHINGDPASNALTNLRWGTPSQNNQDRVLHGTHQEAAKTHCPAGHPYEGDNLYVRPSNGDRSCNQCRRDRYTPDAARRQYAANPEAARERTRRYRAKKKAEANS